MSPKNYVTGSYSHAEGAQSFAIGHQTKNKEQELACCTQQMSDALSHMAKVASTCGLSLTEVMSILQQIYSIGGNAPTMVEYAQEIEKTRVPEKKNPYLEDFEIPHYEFENMDIKNLIDF